MRIEQGNTKYKPGMQLESLTGGRLMITLITTNQNFWENIYKRICKIQ